MLALTDHDGVAGVPEAIEAGERLGVEIVPAIEMSSVHEYAEDLHICGYWIDLEKMQPACDRAQQERRDRAEQIVENLRASASTSRSKTRSARPATPTRSAARTSPTPPEPRTTWARSSRSTWCPVPRPSSPATGPTPTRPARPIREAGGVPVIAHPYWDIKDPEKVERLIRALDIGGIEVYYPPHTKEQTAHLLSLARELGISATASSDYHGPTHKTFSRFGAYNTYGLGEPEVPPRP